MKIAVIAGSAPPLSQGGVASAHYNLFRFLRSNGFDARLFTHEDRSVPPGDDPHIVRALPLRGVAAVTRQATALWFRLTDPGTAAYQLNDVLEWTSAAPALRSNVSRFRPDVIIVPDRGAPLLWLDVPARCRVIQVEHHNPARFSSPLMLAMAPARRDIALAVHLNQRALAKANVVVCPAHYMLEEFQKTYRFSGATIVIPHVMDDSAFEQIAPVSVATHLGLANGTPIVYVPAGGSPVKGERYVFALIQRLRKQRPDVAFFISGTVSPLLREELDLSGVNARVFAPGPLPWLENLALTAGCRVCLAPSLAENFSMAILEALRLGLPVASFDVGGNRDLVDDRCGELVPFLDLEGLASAALRLVDRPDMATAARERARNIQTAAQTGWLDLVRAH
jgi:glycosyltransferase involved in cell wall biosynthesis